MNFFEDKVEPITICKPFKFLGNEGNARVRMYNQLGDGDIDTGDGGKVYTTVSANLKQISTTEVRLELTYNVWESSWEKKRANSDRLFFVATESFNLSEYAKNETIQNGQETTHILRSFTLDDSCLQKVYYKDYFKTDDSRTNWLPVDPESYRENNNPQEWMPCKDLQVKIDGTGKELVEKGNIGVKGLVYITINMRIQKSVYIPDEVIESQQQQNRTKGNFPVLSTIPNKVRNVLGRGYYIDKRYAHTTSLAQGRVLDLDALNSFNRIEVDDNRQYEGETYQGSGLKEYTSSIEKSLSVKVSASGFGVSFSSETKKSFSEERYSKDAYRFLTIKDGIRYQLYRIQGYSRPADVTGFLDTNFAHDLDILTPSSIIEKYGTHVVLGMQMGARLFYNMSYKQAISKLSTARTFSNTTSASLQLKGGGTKENTNKAGMTLQERLFEKGMDGGMKADTIEALSKLINSMPSSNSAASSGKTGGSEGIGKGFSIGASTSYSTSSSQDTQEENETTRITCDGVGGDIKYFKLLESDPTQYQKWIESVSPDSADWCDFIEGTLIPIYEFVPTGKKLSAADVKRAWDAYIEKHKTQIQTIKHEKITHEFEVKGKSVTFNYAKEQGHNYDGDIYTKKGKNTGWTVKFELINIDGGSVGVAVWLTVYEGGHNANKSVLQLRDIVKIPNGNHSKIAVDPACNNNLICEVSGTEYGVCTHYVDITDNKVIKSCPFIDSLSSRLYIRIDGSGDDYKNLAVKGKFKVPCIYY